MSSEELSISSNEFFNQQWQLYQKILFNNYMGHREIYGVLHELLINDLKKPFSLLDLGCGDASFTVQALANTQITSYTGIDLSESALLIAKRNMQRLPCSQTFIQGDLSEWVSKLGQSQPQNFDMILGSFALHHLSFEQKDSVMGQLPHLLKTGGFFLLIDIVRSGNEERTDFIQRYLESIRQSWLKLTPQERSMCEEHMSSSDFPETQETLYSLANKHGFTRVECLYRDSLDTTQILCFWRVRENREKTFELGDKQSTAANIFALRPTP